MLGKLRIYKKVCENATNSKSEIPTYLLTKGADMKGIYKRADGRYMIRKTICGKRFIKYAKTLAEAKMQLTKLNKGKAKSPDKREKPKGKLLSEFAKEWLEVYKKPFMNARTFSDINSFVNRILKNFGNCYLHEITTLQIQTFLNSIPRSRTKEKICTYFNSMLQKATDIGIIQRNPFVAVIKDKKVKCKNNAFTFAEQEQILKAVKNTDIEHEIYLYLMCGCRPNELPRKQCFDFENNLINIYGTKNENALHRQIEMSQAFADYMKNYFESQDTQSEKYVSNQFIAICKELGINKPLLYRLRHTFATNHFTIGTPAKQVQEWLGHSSISMTLDQYTDIDKTATKEKVIKLYNNFYYIKNREKN